MNSKIYTLSKIIRIITVAPIFAAFTVTVLYFFGNGFFGGGLNYVTALLTLTVFPLLAYPVSLIKEPEKRRHFQRSLAIVFAVMGYIAGFIFSLAVKAPVSEKTLYLTYLLSGICIALSSFLFKKKSSGHTCGICGPTAVLIYYISPLYVFAFLILIPIILASLEMKRHTLPQLISGGIIPIVCFIVSLIILK